MFYLLKGTKDREYVGDIIIKKDEIETLALTKIIKKEESFFKIAITMKSKDSWLAIFNTEEEAKTELKNLGVHEDIVSIYVCQIRDEEKDKKEHMKKMLEGSSF